MSRVLKFKEMPEAEQPLSERFRVAAKEWAAADAAANLIEETKSATLAKMMIELGDLPVSRAEMIAKASAEWREHIKMMCDARAKATLLKVKLEYIRMRHSEWQSSEANARAERRLV
jgi:hypothetical protein